MVDENPASVNAGGTLTNCCEAQLRGGIIYVRALVLLVKTVLPNSFLAVILPFPKCPFLPVRINSFSFFSANIRSPSPLGTWGRREEVMNHQE